jgi:hypothetical protein
VIFPIAASSVFILLSAILADPGSAGAITGNEWQGMNSSWRAGYVAGVLDGWAEAASREVAEGKADSAWIKTLSCITTKNITYRQVVATTEKYVKEHPEEWHKEASTLVYHSVAGMCRDTK